MLELCTKYSGTEEEGNNSNWMKRIRQRYTKEVMADQGFEG